MPEYQPIAFVNAPSMGEVRFVQDVLLDGDSLRHLAGRGLSVTSMTVDRPAKRMYRDIPAEGFIAAKAFLLAHWTAHPRWQHTPPVAAQAARAPRLLPPPPSGSARRPQGRSLAP